MSHGRGGREKAAGGGAGRTPFRALHLPVILLLAAAAPGAVIAGTLLPSPAFETGSNPTSVVIADFNGDARPDLAVANTGSGDVSILLGRGDGTFGRQRRYVVGPAPHFLVSADFNADGFADVAVVQDAGVSLLLGRGDGTFGPPDTLPAGINPHSAAIGDLNHDGLPDLLVSNAGQGVCEYDCICLDSDISVFLSQGNARFSLSTLALEGTNCAAEIAIADFDLDGNEDIVLGEIPYGDAMKPNLSFFPGRGDGTFGQPTRPVALKIQPPLATGDFNEDGKLDLIVASEWYPRTITFLRGTGGGEFTSGASFPLADDVWINDIVSGDLDGDGHLDLILTASGRNEVLRFLGRGDGTFTPLSGLAAGRSLSQLALGDVNGDGRIDLAVTSGSGSLGVSVLLGRGSGDFGVGLPPIPQQGSPLAMLSADFDHDNRPDLAVASSSAKRVSFFSGNGDATFRMAFRSPTGTTPVSLAAGDFNNDTHLDLAVANRDSSDVSVLMGDGAMYFLGPYPQVPAGSRPRGVAIGRIDADGFPDLVVANETSNDISVIPGTGYGYFRPQVRYPAGTKPCCVRVADFDRDGFDDIAVASDDGYLTLFRNRGDGTLASPRQFRGGAHPTSLTVTDLDLDGRLDLVTTNSPGYGSGGEIDILRGDGNGSFASPRVLATSETPGVLAVADFNNDGLPDLATADSGSNQVSILLASGPGTFYSPMRFLVGRYPIAIAAGDFDSDGWNDLAVLDSGDSDVRILINQGPRNHPPAAGLRVQGSPECSSFLGATLALDATSSADPDSTPGTNDDIRTFQWYEDYGSASPRYLGPGEQLEVTLPVGTHPITLVVTDSAGSMDTASTVIQVVDTIPPSLRVKLSRTLLWPPDHRMVDILADVESADACGDPNVVLLGITSNETAPAGGSDAPSGTSDIQGADFGTFDLHFQLRATRFGGGSGRIYTVTYQSTDPNGNVSTLDSFVYVPAGLSPAERPPALSPTRSR